MTTHQNEYKWKPQRQRQIGTIDSKLSVTIVAIHFTPIASYLFKCSVRQKIKQKRREKWNQPRINSDQNRFIPTEDVYTWNCNHERSEDFNQGYRFNMKTKLLSAFQLCLTLLIVFSSFLIFCALSFDPNRFICMPNGFFLLTNANSIVFSSIRKMQW